MLAWLDRWWGLIAVVIAVPSGFVWYYGSSPVSDIAMVVNSVCIVGLLGFVVFRAGSPGTGGGMSDAGAGGIAFIGEPDKEHSGGWFTNFLNGPGDGGGGHSGGDGGGGGHGAGGDGGGG